MLLAAGAWLLLGLRLKRGAGSSDTLLRMRGLHRVAWLLLALFALQAGASVAASAAGPACCPAMAAESSEAPAPCRSLSAVGCCEEQAAAATPDVFAPPSPALPAPASLGPLCAEPPVLHPARACGAPVSRALRTTILRL